MGIVLVHAKNRHPSDPPGDTEPSCPTGRKFVREDGRVTIGEAIKLTGASRNTLKQHFRALVGRGTLSQHGSGRGVWYDLR